MESILSRINKSINDNQRNLIGKLILERWQEEKYKQKGVGLKHISIFMDGYKIALEDLLFDLKIRNIKLK